MSIAIRPASTVVLLRDGADGLETFLVRRHDAIAFMGGAHVFPGGRVDDSDADAGYLELADAANDALVRLTDQDSRTAVAFHVAAVREVFEEAGILLARDRTGQFVSFASDFELHPLRLAVANGDLRLLDILRSHQWRLALDALAYVAHWVTPAIETRRFDTRFFLAAAPIQQVAAHDAGETTDGFWVRPGDAIDLCLHGDIALPPPTWTTLRWLEPWRDVNAALSWARQKIVPRIEPGFVTQGETRIITLPGDPTMPRVAGFEAKETRFLLSAGRWTPVG